MIEVPIKDYQFTGIIALIGTVMWLSVVSNINASIGHMFVFAIGASMSALGLLTTLVCFFMGDNVRFKI